jgi:hypothetical protein
MDSLQKKKYNQDLVRNICGINTKIYLWCYRTICSNSRSLLKTFAKIGIDVFKFLGVSIESKNTGGGLGCRI